MRHYHKPSTGQAVRGASRWRCCSTQRLGGVCTMADPDGALWAGNHHAGANERRFTMNVHGDHAASCLCCQHCYISLGSINWSDVTPGGPGDGACGKGHWSVGAEEAPGVLEIAHSLGHNCKDFEPTPA